MQPLNQINIDPLIELVYRSTCMIVTARVARRERARARPSHETDQMVAIEGEGAVNVIKQTSLSGGSI